VYAQLSVWNSSKKSFHTQITEQKILTLCLVITRERKEKRKEEGKGKREENISF